MRNGRRRIDPRDRKQGMLRGRGGRGGRMSRAEQARYRRKYCGHGPDDYKDDPRAKNRLRYVGECCVLFILTLPPKIVAGFAFLRERQEERTHLKSIFLIKKKYIKIWH